jgi:FkbM family methyltransferase
MSKLSHKLNRYSKLVKKFKNWPAFLWFKLTAGKNDSFVFKLRNSFSIRVPRQLLGPFRECFLDEVYLQHINPDILKKEQLVIIDIGANVGYFSLFMFSKFPKARIHAFEPMPYCYNLLKEYQAKYKQFDFHIYPDAVSDKDGTIDLYTDSVDEYTTQASILFTEKAHKVLVHTKPLDHFLNESGISKVDILKLDCEGAEYAILYNLPDQVWNEVSSLSLESHNSDHKSENTIDLANFLKTKNYSVQYKELSKKVGHIWAS